MASDRIGETAANLVAVPPYEVVNTTTDRILLEPTVMQNIHNVPANEPLIASIKENGIKNPFLAMKSWYPIAGSQRLRAVQILKETDPDFNLDVTVHRFLEDWHNCYYLWPDEKFRSDAIAICLLYPSDAADDLPCVDLVCRPVLKKKPNKKQKKNKE